MRAVDHYKEAERCLDSAAEDQGAELEALNLQWAIAHGLLALAGATALTAYSQGTEAELNAWETAAGGDSDE